MPMNSGYLEVQNYPGLEIEPMNGKDWQPVMDKGIKILEDCGFEYQLGSGTLLGIVREEDGYIHHDTDIDIDIIERPENTNFQERITKMVNIFKANGFKLVRTQHYCGLPSQIAFIHVSNKLIFDLCFFYKRWGSDYCNVYEHGVFFRPDYSVDEVEVFEFNGSKYNIPAMFSDYLDGRYGEDWMTPKSGKQSGEKDAAKYLVVL